MDALSCNNNHSFTNMSQPMQQQDKYEKCYFINSTKKESTPIKYEEYMKIMIKQQQDPRHNQW